MFAAMIMVTQNADAVTVELALGRAIRSGRLFGAYGATLMASNWDPSSVSLETLVIQ